MAWILSSDAAASGRQTWACSAGRSRARPRCGCWMNGLPLQCAAAGERSVGRVEDLAVDPAQRHAADQGSDVVTHKPLVAVERRLLDTKHLQVPVEHLVDRRTGARVALLIDLLQQSRARLL